MNNLAELIKSQKCGYELPDDPHDDDSWKKCGKPGFQATVFPPGKYGSHVLDTDYLDIRCREHRFGG